MNVALNFKTGPFLTLPVPNFCDITTFYIT
jgi:hypothetical protein